MSAQRREGRDGLEIKEVWRPQFPAIFSSPHSHSEGLVYIWLRCKLNVFQNTVCYRKYTAMRKCAFYVESPKHRKRLIYSRREQPSLSDYRYQFLPLKHTLSRDRALAGNRKQTYSHQETLASGQGGRGAGGVRQESPASSGSLFTSISIETY